MWSTAERIKSRDWHAGASIEAALIEIELTWGDRIVARRRLCAAYNEKFSTPKTAWPTRSKTRSTVPAEVPSL
jgi:hypothetical protein